MTARKGHPAQPLLRPTGADVLRGAMERLRNNGLSHAEAATEIVRRSFYDYIDSEVERDSEKCPRLRIIKR
jgi:hypothetical protein